MARSTGLVRLVGVGLGRALTAAFVVALVAPGCAGRSISGDEDGDRGGSGDDGPRPPGDDDFDDDDDWPGSGGTVGGVGAAPSGGAYPQGGAYGGAYGGTFPTGGTPVTGGSFAVGGSTPTPPTGGVSTGGMAGVPATGGVGGAPVGGTAGAAGGNTNPECKGIRSNSACVTEGLQCPNLVCGLADSGRRECNCTTLWTCTACDYTNSPFRDRPAMIPACGADAADEVPCLQENSVCGPIGVEYCACYNSPIDGMIWDCDSPPSTWL